MFGKYKHSVDEKGRLFVPSKLRDELEQQTLTPENLAAVMEELGF